VGGAGDERVGLAGAHQGGRLHRGRLGVDQRLGRLEARPARGQERVPGRLDPRRLGRRQHVHADQVRLGGAGGLGDARRVADQGHARHLLLGEHGGGPHDPRVVALGQDEASRRQRRLALERGEKAHQAWAFR
jgi:hypothetical protein